MTKPHKYPLMRLVVDFVFKKVFADSGEESKIILIDFLNCLLALEGEERIKEIIYLNPFNNRTHEKDKLSILDIKVETESKEQIDIEMQINDADDYRKRSLYYWSRMYGDTIKKSKAYYTLKKCIVVSILDFELFKETKKYHTIFTVNEKEEGFELNQDLELHYIELAKFNDDKVIEQMTELEEWITFIKEAGDQDKEEKLEQIAKRKEPIAIAMEILRELSESELERERYLAREKALLDEHSKRVYFDLKLADELAKAKKQAIQQGIEQGIERGAQKGQAEMLLSLLKIKFGQVPKETEEAITQLTGPELTQLANNLFNLNTLQELSIYLPSIYH